LNAYFIQIDFFQKYIIFINYRFKKCHKR